MTTGVVTVLCPSSSSSSISASHSRVLRGGGWTTATSTSLPTCIPASTGVTAETLAPTASAGPCNSPPTPAHPFSVPRLASSAASRPPAAPNGTAWRPPPVSAASSFLLAPAPRFCLLRPPPPFSFPLPPPFLSTSPQKARAPSCSTPLDSTEVETWENAGETPQNTGGGLLSGAPVCVRWRASCDLQRSSRSRYACTAVARGASRIPQATSSTRLVCRA